MRQPEKIWMLRLLAIKDNRLIKFRRVSFTSEMFVVLDCHKEMLKRTKTVAYSGATEKWHRQPFEQSPLFKGLEEKSYAIFWGSGYSAHAVAICGAGEKLE